MQLFNWLTAVSGLCFFLSIVVLIRRDHLHIRYSIWWLAVAAAVGLFGVFPSINDRLASLLGISYPPILPVIVAVLLLLSRLFLADLESSRRSVQLTRLVQQLAIMERRLDKLEKRGQD
ncbi:MAG: DUF2304 domain-containing protein [Halieaceae bacterium]